MTNNLTKYDVTFEGETVVCDSIEEVRDYIYTIYLSTKGEEFATDDPITTAPVARLETGLINYFLDKYKVQIDTWGLLAPSLNNLMWYVMHDCNNTRFVTYTLHADNEA